MKEEKSWTTPTKLGLAAAGAAVLLIAVILPAEYGIDPTGFGRLTSISALSENAPAPARDFGQTMVFNIEEYDPHRRADRTIDPRTHSSRGKTVPYRNDRSKD